MCKYRANTSRLSALEGVEQIIRKWFKKWRGDREEPLGLTDGAGTCPDFRQGGDLCHRLIALAQQNSLSGFQPRQILGKMGFRLMNIQFYHGCRVN
jgi:hypothetical protein